MENYLELFLKQIRVKGSEKTEKDYRNNITKFLDHYKKDVKEITYNDLLDYYTTFFDKLKINSKRTYMSAILSYFRFLYEQSIIKEDITKSFKMPKAEVRDMTYLTMEEALEVANSCKNENRNPLRKKAMFITLVNTGMRASELGALKFSDISSDWIYINHGKGNKARKIPTHPSVLNAINEYVRNERKGNSDFVFVNKSGNPLTLVNIDRDLDSILGKTNINKHISAHRLRDSFATIQYSNGSDIKTIQETLGHSSIQMTLHYVQKVDEIRKQQVLCSGVSF
jgi:site-specific recombinase XerD